MASARKRSSSSSSTSLVLEEEEGKAKKRLLSSSSEEEEKKQKLYAWVRHDRGKDYAYSLFALGIPSPGGTIVETVPIREHPTITEPKRSRVAPALRFPIRKWPRHGLRCIGLDSKLYFLGGEVNLRGTSNKQVHVLDLQSKDYEIPASDRNRPERVLKPVASMNSAKHLPWVSFVADGKIFIVSGNKKSPLMLGGSDSEDSEEEEEKEEFNPFEMFDPSAAGVEGEEGKWDNNLPSPPFDYAYCLAPPLVVDRTVFFSGQSKKQGDFYYCYHIDSRTWEPYSPMDRFGCTRVDLFGSRSRGVVVGETLWHVDQQPDTHDLPVAFRLHITDRKKNKNKNKKRHANDKQFFNDVVRYHLQSRGDQVPSVGWDLTRLGGSSAATAAAAEEEEDSACLCFLQVESLAGLFPGLRRMNVVLFDVHQTRGGGGSDSAKYLTSAHYSAKVDGDPSFKLLDAHIV